MKGGSKMSGNALSDASLNASSEVSIMGMKIGLDSGADFDVASLGGSGEFEGYTGCCLGFGFDEVSIVK